MFRRWGQRLAATVTTALVMSAVGTVAVRADFVTVTSPVVRACDADSPEAAPAPEEEEAGLEINVDQLGLVMLYLLIGEVPTAQLTVVVTTSQGGNTLPGGPGGGGSVEDPVTEPKPEHAPEPAAWLLGVLGGLFWAGAAVVRRRPLAL